MKQATIRQHYYPEGGWGFVVVIGPSMSLPNNFNHQIYLSDLPVSTFYELKYLLIKFTGTERPRFARFLVPEKNLCIWKTVRLVKTQKIRAKFV